MLAVEDALLIYCDPWHNNNAMDMTSHASSWRSDPRRHQSNETLGRMIMQASSGRSESILCWATGILDTTMMLMDMANFASSGRSASMPCLDRRLRLVPGAVEVAAVHLGHQGATKLLSIPKTTQASEVCSNIGDDNSQVCVQVTLWVPAHVYNSCESKRFFTANTKQGVSSFACFEQSTL